MLRVHEPRFLQAFKREFRVVANLRHRNLIKVHELFIDGRHAYFAMELVDGVPITESVRSHLTEGTTSLFVESVRDAFLQLVRGLTSLHRVGIVHRDLKPSNVLRTRAGRVVILDFGQVTVGTKTVRASGGTPAYRAPELDYGTDSGALGDWYAAGSILYEMLGGSLSTLTQLPISEEFFRSVLGTELDAKTDELLVNLATLCEELLGRTPESRPSEARISRCSARPRRKPAKYRAHN
ncbi:MAG: serine/threonine-protein kinase [Polyangiaceae bacterium]